MSGNIQIVLNASSPEELTRLVEMLTPLARSQGVALFAGHPLPVVDPRSMTLTATPVPVVAAPPEPSSNEEDDGDALSAADREADAPDATDDAPARKRGRPPGAKNKTKSEAQPEPQPQADVDLDKLRDDAIALFRAVFSRTSAGGPDIIKKMQAKYGVVKFADVPREKVKDLHADAVAADKATTKDKDVA